MGTSDFLAIAQSYPFIMLDGLPRIKFTKRDRVRRFVFGGFFPTECFRLINLLDVLYENKNKLICLAEASPKDLFERDPTTNGDNISKLNDVEKNEALSSSKGNTSARGLSLT